MTIEQMQVWMGSRPEFTIADTTDLALVSPASLRVAVQPAGSNARFHAAVAMQDSSAIRGAARLTVVSSGKPIAVIPVAMISLGPWLELDFELERDLAKQSMLTIDLGTAIFNVMLKGFMDGL